VRFGLGFVVTKVRNPFFPDVAGVVNSVLGLFVGVVQSVERKVLLVFDDAQHLSIECLETVRELLDQPPNCGLLFAGTYELEKIFTRQALELEQWCSRFHAGQALPGISEQEAAEIVHSELGVRLTQPKIQKLISKSRITDLRNGGQHSYVSARRLFWVIRELQTVTNGASIHPRHQQ
jgi:type II secretory pathway predicted ATPase ExeA